MVGKFNGALFFNGSGVLTVCGPVTWDAADAGKTVNIRAELTQNGQTVNCNKDFVVPTGVSFPFESSWSMPLATNNIGPGTASGHARGKVNGTVLDQWDQPEPPNQLPRIVIA